MWIQPETVNHGIGFVWIEESVTLQIFHMVNSISPCIIAETCLVFVVVVISENNKDFLIFIWRHIISLKTRMFVLKQKSLLYPEAKYKSSSNESINVNKGTQFVVIFSNTTSENEKIYSFFCVNKVFQIQNNRWLSKWKRFNGRLRSV